MKDRVIFYIDSSNLYLQSKGACGEGRIHLKKFTKFLANDRPIKLIKYFCVDPPSPEPSHFNMRTSRGRAKYADAAEKYTKQISWQQHIGQWKKMALIKGRLQRSKNGKLLEKGVDVALAIHLIVDASRKEHETSIVISGDADLVFPINIAKNWGMRVEGAAFEPCYRISQACDFFTILKPDLIEPFLIKHRK